MAGGSGEEVTKNSNQKLLPIVSAPSSSIWPSFNFWTHWGRVTWLIEQASGGEFCSVFRNDTSPRFEGGNFIRIKHLTNSLRKHSTPKEFINDSEKSWKESYIFQMHHSHDVTANRKLVVLKESHCLFLIARAKKKNLERWQARWTSIIRP